MSTDDQAPGTPPDDTGDEAYHRVRDADPAATATPDLSAIAAKDATVRAHLGEAVPPVMGSPGEQDPATGATASGEDAEEVDEPGRPPRAQAAPRAAGRRRRRGCRGRARVRGRRVRARERRRNVGRSVGRGRGRAHLLQERAAGDQSAPAAPEGASSSAADARMSGLAGFGGRTVFRSSGLGTEGASAPAWAYDAAGTFSAGTTAKVAAALGVAGEPRQEYGAWVVGANDGQGPTVSLQPDGTTSVSFNDPGKDPWACSVVVTPESGSATTEEMIDPQAGCGQPDLGPAPSADAAISASKDVLGSLDLDPAGFEYTTESYDTEGKVLAVTASQVVDGQRTGVVWSLTYSGAGLSSLYGSLAPTVSVGDYAVVSPSAAVERLGDPRFGSPGFVAYARPAGTATTLEGFATDFAPAEPEVPTVPPTAGEGAAVSWPVAEVTITSARLGWAVHYQADGGALLVPSYELSDAEGNVWSVVAVVDDRLDFSPAG